MHSLDLMMSSLLFYHRNRKHFKHHRQWTRTRPEEWNSPGQEGHNPPHQPQTPYDLYSLSPIHAGPDSNQGSQSRLISCECFQSGLKSDFPKTSSLGIQISIKLIFWGEGHLYWSRVYEGGVPPILKPLRPASKALGFNIIIGVVWLNRCGLVNHGTWSM